jgi:hypothetical protein
MINCDTYMFHMTIGCASAKHLIVDSQMSNIYVSDDEEEYPRPLKSHSAPIRQSVGNNEDMAHSYHPKHDNRRYTWILFRLALRNSRILKETSLPRIATPYWQVTCL